jgi:myosin-5
MLEHVSLPSILDGGASGGRPSGMRSSGLPSENGKETYTIESLIKKLTEFLNILKSHGLDPEIVNQIFKQLYFFIGATTFNNLLLRKDMCNWSKGMELRFNTSLLEQFVRDSRLQDSGAVEALGPIIQTCQLLQSRKTDADIKSICEMCSKLTMAQIQRILFLYTPLDSYEEKLTRTFIDKVTSNLKELRKFESNAEQQVLIIDTKRQFPISIPFNPSSIGLESIEIPEQLDLCFLKKI